MATIKKACKGTLYPKSSNVSSRLGSVKKAKSGTSLGMKSVKAGFDKNPGVTRADIIVAGKGQAKKGAKVKKAQDGEITPYTRPSTGIRNVSGKYKSDDKNYVTKFKTDDSGNITSMKSRRTLKGLLSGAANLKRNLKKVVK